MQQYPSWHDDEHSSDSSADFIVSALPNYLVFSNCFQRNRPSDSEWLQSSRENHSDSQSPFILVLLSNLPLFSSINGTLFVFPQSQPLPVLSLRLHCRRRAHAIRRDAPAEAWGDRI